MTAPDAVDTAGRPDPQALAADGVKLVSRYLAPLPNPKVVTGAEITALHAAGIAVLLNWEASGTAAQGGAAQGAQDGAAAAAMAETLGAPHGLTVFYSVDFDAQSGDFAALRAYFAAINTATAGRYRVGVYGSGDVVDELKIWGLAAAFWQTYAWSGTYLSPNADLYQYHNNATLPGVGVSVDEDQIINLPALGAWAPVDPPKGNSMNFRLMKDPRNTANWWAVGDTWMIQMSSAAVAAVWQSMPDCLSSAIETPDAAHWDQYCRRAMLTQTTSGASLGDALNSTLGSALQLGETELTTLQSEVGEIQFPTAAAIAAEVIAGLSTGTAGPTLVQITEAFTAAITGLSVTATIGESS